MSSTRIASVLQQAVIDGRLKPTQVVGNERQLLSLARNLVDSDGCKVVHKSCIDAESDRLSSVASYAEAVQHGETYSKGSLDRYVLAVTSLSPSQKALQRQTAALNSWVQFGLSIVAVQRGEEVASLRSVYPQVGTWIKCEESRGLYARETQLIKNLAMVANQTGRSALLINSDIEIYGRQDDLLSRLELPKSLVVGIRFNYAASGTHAYREKYGLDVFVLTPAMARSLPDSPLSIGRPVWDYWLPAHFQSLGYSMEFIGDPLFFHRAHCVNWTQDEWMLGAQWLESKYGEDVFSVATCVDFRQRLPFPPKKYQMVDSVLEALVGRDYDRIASESDLQRQVEQRLRDHTNLDFESQVQLDANSVRDRVDVLCESIAIELKVGGSSSSVLSQLERYAQSDRVTELVLVTTKATHLKLRGTVLYGKPVYVIVVGSL